MIAAVESQTEQSQIEDPAPEDTTPDAEAPAPETEEFARVEIMGHRLHYGRVAEVQRFGAAMIQVDVPIDGDFAKGFHSVFYGGAAIFSMTPTDKATVEHHNRPASEHARLLSYGGDRGAEEDFGEEEDYPL